jgi:hypothetical protein
MYKIFVGTLYSGEGDIEFCKNALLKQHDVEIKQEIIENLLEIDAHNKLWSLWKDNKHNFDLFVKIDADTVLRDEKILFEISKVFQSDINITGMQCPLQDYFTDSHINGLNCFSKKVEFNNSKNELFCDRNVDFNHKIVIKSENVPKALSPAGYHCYYANEMQAFHYGLHRKLKNQNSIINATKIAWEKNNYDVIRGYALLGALFSKDFRNNLKCNYTDTLFRKMFEYCKSNYNILINDI